MADIPVVPPASHLARDTILKSMLEHVSKYEKKFPLVKIDVLKDSVLQKVIDAPEKDNNTKFDPEVQLRGFLQAFEDTLAFKAEFNILDDATRNQINAFKDNTHWEKTVEGGFRFPDINPNVSNILTALPSSPSLFIRLRDFFLRCFIHVARPVVRLLMRFQVGRATKKLKEAQATVYAGGPKIYEDVAGTRVMDVSTPQSRPSFQKLTSVGFLWSAFRELGTIRQQ